MLKSNALSSRRCRARGHSETGLQHTMSLGRLPPLPRLSLTRRPSPTGRSPRGRVEENLLQPLSCSFLRTIQLCPPPIKADRLKIIFLSLSPFHLSSAPLTSCVCHYSSSLSLLFPHRRLLLLSFLSSSLLGEQLKTLSAHVCENQGGMACLFQLSCVWTCKSVLAVCVSN